MSNDLARGLLEAGRCHALSANLLYRASIKEAHRREIADPDLFALNGTHFGIVCIALNDHLGARVANPSTRWR